MKGLANLLAFFSILCTFPLFLEIWRKIHRRDSSLLLTIFLNIFWLLGLNTAWYVLLGYRTEWKQWMDDLVMWAVFIPVWIVLRRYKAEEHILVLVVVFIMKIARAVIRLKTGKAGKNITYKQIAGDLLQDPEISEPKEVFQMLILVVSFFLLLTICDWIGNRAAPQLNLQLDQLVQEYKE